MLDSARRAVPIPSLARWLLGLGIAATLVANVAHGLGYGLAGAAVAAAHRRGSRISRAVLINPRSRPTSSARLTIEAMYSF